MMCILCPLLTKAFKRLCSGLLLSLLIVSFLNVKYCSVIASVRPEGSYSPDFGTYVGRFMTYTKAIDGTVYVVDEHHLFIKDFRYEQSGGPGTFFWVGNSQQPDPTGRLVPYPPIGPPPGADMVLPASGIRQRNSFKTRFNRQGDESDDEDHEITSHSKGNDKIPPLTMMTNANILLRLPDRLKVQDISWFSIWCTRFAVNYAHVYIPGGLHIPRPVVLDMFPRIVDRLNSEPITVMDTKSIFMPNLFLMIPENGYHFWVGNSSNGIPNNDGVMVANEKGKFDNVKFYGGEDIIVTLPESISIFDINYFSVYNPETGHTLGHVSFDVRGFRIPPALGQTKKLGWWFETPIVSVDTTPPPRPPPTEIDTRERFVPFNPNMDLPNCRELLGRKIRLMWKNLGEQIYFRVKVHMKTHHYAAIGIAAPGSPNIEADVIKIYYNETLKRYVIEDSFISKQVFCDFSTGLCPDAAHSTLDNIDYMGSLKQHDLSIIDFKRLFPPGDMHDAPISMQGPTQVIVAIGSLHTPVPSTGLSGRRYHFPTSDPFEDTRMELENTTIDFSLIQPEKSCPDLSNARRFADQDPVEAWSSKVIKYVDLLVAHLGPPGGSKGYEAITGNPPLEGNVVWWINGLLMPEIYVERGKTYYFRVQGGDNEMSSVNYHPLYITDHRDGGYGIKDPMERDIETIYAGVSFLGSEPMPTGVGPLCEFVTTNGADKAEESETFEDYKSTLHLACEPGRANEYGWVNWTVQMNTPNTVYYQSYNAFGLGNKIHVVNEGEVISAGCLRISGSSMTVLFITTTLFSMCRRI